MEQNACAVDKNYFATCNLRGGHSKLNKRSTIIDRFLLVLEFTIPVMEYVVGYILLAAPFLL